MPLPPGCTEASVVGGHAGMLQAASLPLVFKPLQSGDRGKAELGFYEEVARRPPGSAPGRFMATYHGIAHEAHPDTAYPPRHYLVLEDLTRPFRHPCVLDVKVGVQTWNPGASQEKISAELRKFPLQQRVGFRVTGMRVWDVTQGAFRERGRAYGYSLTEAQLHRAFAEFLHDGQGVRTELIPPLLERLRGVQAWFAEQSE